MRAIFIIILCSFIAGCFPSKISPFIDEKPAFPLINNSVIFLEQELTKGKNFNPILIFTSALNNGIRIKRDGNSYKADGLLPSSKSIENGSFVLRFFPLPKNKDHYLIEISSTNKKQTGQFVTFLARITNHTIQIYDFEPVEKLPKLSSEFTAFNGNITNSLSAKEQIFDISSRFLDRPELHEASRNFPLNLDLIILDPVTDKLMISSLFDKSKSSVAKEKEKITEREVKNRQIKLINSAKKKRLNGDYIGSIKDYTTYLKDNPSDKNALRGRLQAYEFSDQIDLAYKDYDTLIALFPDDTSFLFDKGFRQYLEKDYSDAIETLNRLINHPNRSYRSFSAKEYRALSFAGLGRFDQALAEFAQMLETAPNSFKFLRHISDIYKEMGDTSNAIAYLTKAIDSGVGSEDYKVNFALRDRARLYESLELYRNAVADWSTIISTGQIGDNYTEYHYRGESYTKLGDLQYAINDFTFVLDRVEDKWDLSRSFWSRGYAYILLENYAAAVNDYNAYIELVDSNSSAFNNRGYAYRKLGKDILANADFERAKALEKNN